MDYQTKQQKLLIVAELLNGDLAPITLELARSGREITNQMGAKLCGAVVGNDVNTIAKRMAKIVDEVYMLDHFLLKTFQAELFAYALENLCKEINPFIVIMGHNLQNLTLAPKLAYRLGAEIITDCISLTVKLPDNNILVTKAVFGAKFLSTFNFENTRCVVTLRPGSVEPIDPIFKEGIVIPFSLNLDPSMIKVKTIKAVKEEDVSLDKADVIVSGGRGVRDAEGLQLLYDLIKAFKKHFSHVELGGSRPLVDLHIIPSSRQIGLTGKIVAPKLYLAIGISGSLQHVTGIMKAKKIIAINVDPKSNIFKVADYGIVGKFEDILPPLIKKLEESV